MSRPEPRAERAAEPHQSKVTCNPQEQAWTYEAVAKLRAKLIDLSRKSPLIAFKHTSRSASQLRFVDERPDLLWQALNEGAMGFEPLPGEEQTPGDEHTPQFGIAYERARLTDAEFLAATEKLGDDERDARAWQDAERALRGRVRESLGLPRLDYGRGLDVAALAKAHGFDPSYDLKNSDADGRNEHHDDDAIRVLLTRKELDRRLKTIAGKATSHLRETGHHTLHLVFGFVQWFEDDFSDIVSHAPLLIQPVALEKEEKGARKDYRLKVWEGGLEVNVALTEKAREHWGLTLPALRDEESPESYFIRAKAVLDQGRRITLRTFVTLAVLPPMVLWRDLDPTKWPEGAFAEHRLLPGLIGATELAGTAGDGTVIDIDDPANAARVPALITEADASQHRAIMAMAAGRDMAIEGPPGTGKSQTITNMIATALAQGKRVLFVAEKQAALRVVSNRLRVAGFGPLLLELHGDKASRTEVYKGLRERLDARPCYDARAVDGKRTELRRHRDLLRRYLALVRMPLGKLGDTAHALAWREIRLRDRFESAQIKAMTARWSPADPFGLERATLAENRELLAQFGVALMAVDQARDGVRTRWAIAGRLDPFDQSSALEAAAAAGRAADAFVRAAERFNELGVGLPGPDGAVDAASAQLRAVTPFTCADNAVVGAAVHHREAAIALIAAQRDWRTLRDGLAEAVDHPDSVKEEAVEGLSDALGIERCPETLALAAGQRADHEQLSALLSGALRDLERVVAKLERGPQSVVADAASVANRIAALGKIEQSTAPLLGGALLDQAAGAVIAAATREARTLKAERDALASLIAPEAMTIAPGELDELVETLESTGAFARVFSGHYKAAKRRTARLIVDASDRMQAAMLLRRLARFRRASTSFAGESKARALFPAFLWEGIASDFAALTAAHGLAIATAAHLSTVDQVALLRWWLATDATDRQSFSAACERLATILAGAADAGFATVTVSDLAPACQSRIEELRRLESVSAAIGVRPDASLRGFTGSLADDLSHLHRARQTFSDLQSTGAFGWVGDVDASLDMLQRSLDELEVVRNITGPVDLTTLLKQSQMPATLLRAVSEASSELGVAEQSWQVASEVLREMAEIEAATLGAGQDWEAMALALHLLSTDRRGASLVADLLKYRAALSAHGLSAFADVAASGDAPAERLDDLYELLSISAVLRSYLGNDGQELGRLGSLSLDAARQSFKRVDKELNKLEAVEIAAARVEDKAPVGIGHGRKADYSELRLLHHEIGLKRPSTPLRDVAHRAGAALQALKPVWMMSPTSIAQYIRPGSLEFDLLIVDEASQMRPEFSISCIMRADQFVVVGDANQLPPSDHFQVAGAAEAQDEDSVGVDENTESILDLANQKFRTKPRLKWHYRSQHESLIQFSNREFYDRDLVVFPSPMGNEDDFLGVKCFYAPKTYPDTIYEASLNQREAQLVIEQAFGLMHTHPDRSIGIVAMNAKQTELLQNEFDRLIVEEERVRKYVESFAGTIDEFFIKNLENVQGDERDIILISTVYGPDKSGAVRQNFGLMNRETGWRRLNVLVTRAKMSCRLVTSLRPDDVKVTEKSSRGVTAFKSYLTYAHGGAQYDDASGGETDSDFEIFVADALRGGGYEVIYQVGVENFRIDLGVKHPTCPVGFIAGIECDGAPYHSGLSVRDRDHIRQTVLEQLGWNIYRVWSTDWFADPARETAKLLAWLEHVRARIERELGDRPPPTAGGVPKPRPAPPVPTPASPSRPESTVALAHASPPDSATEPAALGPREPRGRELRSLGDFESYEAVRGRLYEIWRDDVFLGEVEVIRRATAAPRLYGDRAVAPQSEYEGRVEASGDCFRSFDVYAAMREVAKRASDDVN